MKLDVIDRSAQKAHVSPRDVHDGLRAHDERAAYDALRDGERSR